MQHLTKEKLSELTLRWEQWEAEATTVGRRIVRARLHLLFLLIRYGGLRLNEAVAMNVRQCVDTATGMIHIPEDENRNIMLPLVCMRNVRRIISLPESESMGAGFLGFDQGFIRKKFYAVAAEVGLKSSQAGPRALRYARGLELLELHVPLRVVIQFLGLNNASQIGTFLTYCMGKELAKNEDFFFSKKA